MVRSRVFRNALLGLMAVLLVVAGLALLSYRTTQGRAFGGYAPFEARLSVTDPAGNPIPQPILRILNARDGRQAAPSFLDLDQDMRMVGDQQGTLILRHDPFGVEWEIDQWRLFWLITIRSSSIPEFDSYQAEITAPGYQSHLAPLLELLPASEDDDRRSRAQIILTPAP